MSDFQKWSVLAFRALDDAGRVLMTIEPESTHEGLLLDQLKETLRDLLAQALVLNGVTTRRQMDKQFQFGKLDTDALLIAKSKEQQAEPVGWLDGTDKLAEFMHRDLKADHDKRGSITPRDFTIPVYTSPLQRKPLTDEEIAVAWSVADGEHNASASVKRRITRAIETAHGIKEAKP